MCSQQCSKRCPAFPHYLCFCGLSCPHCRFCCSMCAMACHAFTASWMSATEAHCAMRLSARITGSGFAQIEVRLRALCISKSIYIYMYIYIYIYTYIYIYLYIYNTRTVNINKNSSYMQHYTLLCNATLYAVMQRYTSIRIRGEYN